MAGYPGLPAHTPKGWGGNAKRKLKRKKLELTTAQNILNQCARLLRDEGFEIKNPKDIVGGLKELLENGPVVQHLHAEIPVGPGTTIPGLPGATLHDGATLEIDIEMLEIELEIGAPPVGSFHDIVDFGDTQPATPAAIAQDSGVPDGMDPEAIADFFEKRQNKMFARVEKTGVKYRSGPGKRVEGAPQRGGGSARIPLDEQRRIMQRMTGNNYDAPGGNRTFKPD